MQGLRNFWNKRSNNVDTQRLISALWMKLEAQPSPRKRTLLGMDVGNRYVGLALSDTSLTNANPLTVLERRRFGPAESKWSPSKATNFNFKPHLSQQQKKKGPTGDGLYRPSFNVSIQEFAKTLKQLLKKHSVQAIVVGMPFTLINKMDTQTEHTLKFIQDLKKIGNIRTQIFWWNELYTTAVVRERYKEDGIPVPKRIDHEAAAEILGDFMNYARSIGTKQPLPTNEKV